MLNSLFNSGGCYNLSLIVRGSQIDSPFFSPLTAIIRLASVDKIIAHRFLFSFSLIDLPKRCCPSPPSMYLSHRPSVRPYGHFLRVIFTSSVMYFLSFHIIRDVFSPISHHISLLHCLHCLSTILPQITIPFFLSILGLVMSIA